MTKKIDPALIPKAPDLSLEVAAWQAGFRSIVGIDEAGRGALAGPVAAAAVIFPADERLNERLIGVRDSKQLTPGQREIQRKVVEKYTLSCGIGFASAQEIDACGIVPATRLAIERALAALHMTVDFLLLDCLFLPEIDTPQASLVKGDQRSLSIAAASILAKTERDALMRELEVSYPGYGFAAHKGYGTQAHRQALERLGHSPIHRRTFHVR